MLTINAAKGPHVDGNDFTVQLCKSEGGITSCHVWRFTPVTPQRTFVVDAEVFHGAPVGLLAPLVQSRWSRLFQQSVSGLARAVAAAPAAVAPPEPAPGT